MIKTSETKGRFFSVRLGTVIRGVRYTPAVCYRLTSDIQAAVEEMAKGDNPHARIYTEEVRFVSGVAYPVKKPEPVKTAARPSSATAVSVASGVQKEAGKSGTKRTGKAAFTQQTGRREFD